jgi:lipopolysaccharide transport protein LptA
MRTAAQRLFFCSLPPALHAVIGAAWFAVACVVTTTAAADDEADVPPTEINADTLDYDVNNRVANFAGNVHAFDEQLDLKADKMKVQFGDDSRVRRIDAEGNVTITRDDSVAIGGRAVYDVTKNSVTLFDYPVLVQGRNRMRGAERIIYNRATGKFSTEGGRIVIEVHREEGDTRKLDAEEPAPAEAPPPATEPEENAAD